MKIAMVDQQRLFVEAYVLGHGNATKAAIDAGYSPASARQTASRLLHAPHVQEAIRRAQAHGLKGRMATKALGVLEKILDDESAPAGVRVDAAKTVLDRAGMGAIRTPDHAVENDKPVAEMTVAELDALVRAEPRISLNMAFPVSRFRRRQRRSGSRRVFYSKIYSRLGWMQ
jgi:phage terminase small subunit